jgi:hypothetical protein
MAAMGVLKRIRAYSAYLFHSKTASSSAKVGDMHLFKAGTQQRTSSTIKVALYHSEQGKSMPLHDFLQHGSAASWYVLQLPLAAPDAPLSRMLHPQSVIDRLATKSLSEILSTTMVLDQATLEGDKCEFFCWSVMDYVLAFPYVHPDGYLPGTIEHLDWRTSIQKQHALLLHQRQLKKKKMVAWRKCLEAVPQSMEGLQDWMLIDDYGNEQKNIIQAMKNEVHHAENEYFAVVQKVNEFRREQRMLRKALQQTIDMFLTKAKAESTLENITHPSGKNQHAVILRPLNLSHKRKADHDAPQHSRARDQEGHTFIAAQKKQRKLSHSASNQGDSATCANSTVLIEEAHNSKVPEHNSHGDDISEDWEHVISEAHEDHDRHEAPETGAEAGDKSDVSKLLPLMLDDPKIPSEGLSKLPLTHDEHGTSKSTEYDDKLDAVRSTLAGMKLKREKIAAVRTDFGDALARSSWLDELKSMELSLMRMQIEFNVLNQVRDNIAMALRPQITQKLSVEEITALIPIEGIEYRDLVEELADRVPDTTASIKMLAKLIEQAGCVDGEKVYRRGRVEFGGFMEG